LNAAGLRRCSVVGAVGARVRARDLPGLLSSLPAVRVCGQSPLGQPRGQDAPRFGAACAVIGTLTGDLRRSHPPATSTSISAPAHTRPVTSNFTMHTTHSKSARAPSATPSTTSGPSWPESDTPQPPPHNGSPTHTHCSPPPYRPCHGTRPPHQVDVLRLQPTRQREPAMKVQDTVRAHPAQQFHRQVGQQERQPDHVVAGVEDNEDRQAAVLQCLAARRRSTTSRSCAAVTAVSSSPGPSRTASSSAHQEVRPGSRAATIEYGQPGIICAEPLPRP
jgi:hypothetical protein